MLCFCRCTQHVCDTSWGREYNSINNSNDINTDNDYKNDDDNKSIFIFHHILVHISFKGKENPEQMYA